MRLLAPLYPYVKVEVAAVSAGEAYRFAQAAVDAALKRIGVESPAEPHILSTDWKEAPEDAYQAARRKHGTVQETGPVTALELVDPFTS